MKYQHKILSKGNLFVPNVYFSTRDRILEAVLGGRKLLRNSFDSSDMITVKRKIKLIQS